MRADFDESDFDFVCSRRIWSREQTKNGVNVWFLSTWLSKIGACGTESRQKTGETSDFCLPDSPKSGRAVLKVDKNGGNVWFLSTWLSKIGVRGLENRQKLGEMFDFCLPPPPKTGRTEPKVDKNRWECLIFVYLTLQNQGAWSRK